MRVLIACDCQFSPNPFVRTLADSINQEGIDVTCSLSDFWHKWEEYDIIHLQWPELLVKGLNNVEELRNHFCAIRDAGKPLVVTCHNLHPHYSGNELLAEAYNVVNENVCCFIHLGAFSCQILKEKYPNAMHVIIPHHIYDTVYTVIPSREEAIHKLRLDPKKSYILCFGAFRHDEEREIALRASEIIRVYNGRVIAPHFSEAVYLYKRFWITIQYFFLYIYRRLRFRNIIMTPFSFVSDKDLPYYYAAADIALIQRRKILNSGNLPMAFFMGKVVVGPNIGNVGDILNTTGNPTFDVCDLDTLEEAIINAVSLVKEDKGRANQEYALRYYSSKTIAKLHSELYRSLCKL